MFTPLTRKLDSFITMGVPFYDCIVMKDGECVYRRGGGYTDNKNKTVTGKEKYNLYSATKLITLTAALQLWENGLFSLDDKLSLYMPEFEHMTVKRAGVISPAKKPILIQDLFTMTAGFSYSLNTPGIALCKKETGGKCQTRTLMRYLAKDPLVYEPGEFWNYSLCHDVLAALVEVVSGLKFGEYVNQNIFIPLGMINSTFSSNDELLFELANQYKYSDSLGTYETSKKNQFRLGSEYESGGAGCISTVDDFIKLLEALRIGDVILKRETVDLFTKNRLTKKQLSTYWFSDYGYSLGQRCPKDERVQDFGWAGAAGSYHAVDREAGISVFLATHVLNHTEFLNKSPIILPIIQEILK